MSDHSKRRRIGEYVKGESTSNPYYRDWVLLEDEDSQVLVPPDSSELEGLDEEPAVESEAPEAVEPQGPEGGELN